MTNQVAEIDFTKTHVQGVETVYADFGTGPDLLYLHGAATLEGISFLKALAQSHRVIAPFHPGYGPGQDGQGLRGGQDSVVHYMDFIEALGLKTPHLLGFSMGGWLAAELCVFYGHALGALALMAPAGLYTPDLPCPDLDTIAPEDFAGYLTYNPAIAAQFFPGGAAAPDSATFEADRARDAAAQALLAAPFGMGHPSMARWLKRIKNPVKLFWGSEDRLVPTAYLNRWQAAIPNAQVSLISGAGHLLMYERPEMISEVAEFFQTHASSRFDDKGDC